MKHSARSSPSLAMPANAGQADGQARSRRDCLRLAGGAMASAWLLGCGGGNSGALSPSTQEAVHWCREEIRSALARPDSATSAVSVALFAQERVVWREAFGQADRERGVAATPDTRFNIASVSKVVAVLAVMLLRDRGLLQLDQPVAQLLPGFRMASPGYTQITVRHLMSHSSGMPGSNFRNGYLFGPYSHYAQDTLDALAHAHLKHAPGEMACYCNDGFTLLELLVRQLSGVPFTDFVQREIFQPLGMRQTAFATALNVERDVAYPWEDGRSLAQEYPASYATGGIVSTPGDMMAFAQLLLDEGRFAGRRMVSAEAIREMGRDQTERNPVNPTPASARFGLGWDTVQQQGIAAVGLRAWNKNGGTHFFYTEFLVLPEARLAVLITGCGYDYGGLALAEGLLLRAATERHMLAALPPPIRLSVPPRASDAQGPAPRDGVYANGDVPLYLRTAPDGSLSLARWRGESWSPEVAGLHLRTDGRWWSDEQPALAYYFEELAGQHCLLHRGVPPKGHYVYAGVLGQWLPPNATPLSPAWQARVGSRWNCIDEAPNSVVLRKGAITARIDTLDELPGYLKFQIAQSGGGLLNLVQFMRPNSDAHAAMCVKAPGHAGRDLIELRFDAADAAQRLHAFGLTFEQLPS